MSEYRVESGSVYKSDKEADAYVFYGELNGRTLDEFLADMENTWDSEL